MYIARMGCFNRNLLFSILTTFSLWFVSSQSYGQTCAPISGGANINVTSSCSDLVMDSAGNVVINSGVTISNTGAPAISIINGVSSKDLTINGNLSGRVDVDSSSSLNQITNNGTITTPGGGINVWGSVNTVINNGQLVSGSWWGIQAEGGATITNLINTGSILAYSAVGLNGQILYITNTGTINSSSNDKGIMANGYGPLVLNNSQGAGNAYGPLTYRGILPTNYNIIINSPNSYGQLAVTNATGSATTFGVYTGSAALNNYKYTAVISGLAENQITDGSKSGTYGGYSWLLSLQSGSSDIWDLIFGTPVYGPSVANTNQSLVNSSAILQGTFTLQNTVMVNSFTYDCPVFDKHGICVSAGGRNTAVQAQGINNTSGLIIASYRLDKNNSRIGAYADQNLSVSGPGTVQLGNNTPMMGLFGVWSERPDGIGAEVKVSAAYGQKSTTVNRGVVGTGADASEAGSGGSNLTSQGAQAVVKYGFGVMQDVVVSPYAGIRYTQNNMGGYTEASSSAVTAPLAYGSLNTNATTALAGAEAKYRGIPKTTLFASAGVETDTNTANGSYNASNASIGTLTPVNFNPNSVKTRPTASVGATYLVEKNQQLGLSGIYRQEPFQAVSTTTVMATYTVGF
jgi:hypothetical protein